MKMNKIFNFLLIVGAVSFTASCSDYLSETPDNRTKLDNPDKVAELLTSAYPSASYYYMAETRSDNAGDRKTINNSDRLNTDYYTWEVPIDESYDSPTQYWEESYKAIAQANYGLQAIEEQSDGSEEWQKLKGEALVCRAYAHFMLVNLWGKHYDPATASVDLGVPYVDEPETTLIKEYTRNTVEEVYNRVEQDMLEGMELLGSDYEQPAYHFTPTAAYAFATRFYLYKGDWDKVITYANKALNGDISSKIRDVVANSSLETYTALRRYTSDEEPANILLVDAPSIWNDQRRPIREYRFGFNPDLYEELYNSPNPYNKAWVYPIYGQSPAYYLLKFDEYFKVDNISAQTGNPYTRNVLFSYDEILLARAEAFAMKGQFGNALNDLNVYLPKKTSNYNPSTDVLTEEDLIARYPVMENEFQPYYIGEMSNEQISFVKGIAELKRREYFSEGLRWFDIKRFHLAVEHSIFNGTDDTLGPNDNRRLVQIPNSAITQGIEPNPR